MRKLLQNEQGHWNAQIIAALIAAAATLLVTVYDVDGNQASARHRFAVAPAPISVEP